MEEQQAEQAMVVSNQSIVMPAVSPQEAKKAWDGYLELKKAIVDENDIQTFGKEKFLKKSYWRKVTTYFNLTVTILEEKKEVDPEDKNNITYHFTVEAIAPNGRSMPGVGTCSSFEKATFKDGEWVDKWGKPANPNSEHNVRSTAQTRAENRAVSDLVGGGEVSADEIVQSDQPDGDSAPASTAQRTAAKATAVKKTTPAVEEVEEVAANEVEDAPVNKPLPFDPPAESEEITDEEIEEMYTLAEDKGFSKDETLKNIKQVFKKDDPKLLTKGQYERVMNGLSQQKTKGGS